jgi:hypothetical protein
MHRSRRHESSLTLAGFARRPGDAGVGLLASRGGGEIASLRWGAACRSGWSGSLSLAPGVNGAATGKAPGNGTDDVPASRSRTSASSDAGAVMEAVLGTRPAARTLLARVGARRRSGSYALGFDDGFRAARLPSLQSCGRVAEAVCPLPLTGFVWLGDVCPFSRSSNPTIGYSGARANRCSSTTTALARAR